MTDCQGTWREVPVPALDGDPDDDAPRYEVLKCSGCGEWWVLHGRYAMQSVGVYDPSLSLPDVLALAMADRALAR